MAQPRLWDAPAEEIEVWLHQPADPTPEPLSGSKEDDSDG